MMTSAALDALFATRREVIAHTGGCPETDIPVSLLADMTDEQFFALFPSSGYVAIDIWRAAKPSEVLATTVERHATTGVA